MYHAPPKILSVQLPGLVHHAIHTAAAQRGMSASELVRRELVQMPMFSPPKIKQTPVRKLSR